MSALPALRLAVVSLLRDLFPDASVTYGPPVDYAAQMAYVNAARIPSNQQPSTSGGVRRSRDEVAEIDVVLSCYIPGVPAVADDAQQQAYEAAHALYDALEDHFRDRDATPLAEGSRDARIDHADDEIYMATERDDEGNEYPTGWICDVTATITTTTRLA